MKHIKVTVSGRVQGVYFRASTQEVAERLQLKGFVRNQNDGSVYLEAQGEENAIAELLQWLKSGPPAARVDKLDIEEGNGEALENFSITR